MILNNHVADFTHSPKLLTTTLYNVHSADDDAAIWLKDATIKAFTKKNKIPLSLPLWDSNQLIAQHIHNVCNNVMIDNLPDSQ